MAIPMAMAAPESARDYRAAVYDCEAVTDGDNKGRLKISFLRPTRDLAEIQHLKVRNLKIDDPSKLTSFFYGVPLEGWTTGTGVVEVFPQDRRGGQIWLRLIPNDDFTSADLRGFYLYSGHAAPTGNMVGKCTISEVATVMDRKQ